ncbi:MAG: site-specific DNA-methyltransferase [Patescibacteria group bacterium]
MVNPSDKQRAPRNQTITLDNSEINALKKRYIKVKTNVDLTSILNKTINGDTFKILELLPKKFIDLVFVDPPYNLNKTFNSNTFKEMEYKEYVNWLDQWVSKLAPLLKPEASIYICGDWKSSSAIFAVASKYFHIQNRITWEREKGRGAKSNWKNCSEDIWFCTMSEDYYFDVDAVKSKRKVIAPYKNDSGEPKDWEDEEDGKYRLTHPSNLWTDLTVPFWSMPENTDHPTQKPEKLVAKAILASSKPGQIVFDPFLGSGTTSVVAKKLNRQYVGIELDEFYSCVSEKRLSMAEYDDAIQGYSNGIFWERNTTALQNGNGSKPKEKIVEFDKTIRKPSYAKQKSLFTNFVQV